MSDPWACISLQVGDLFRTRAFNFHARKAAPPRSLDTLTLRELYALKTETSNRALSAKMLADIYKKLESIHVQSTCRINTPLITQCLQSPIVSRYAVLVFEDCIISVPMLDDAASTCHSSHSAFNHPLSLGMQLCSEFV